MTESLSVGGPEVSEARPDTPTSSSAALRIAVLDRDSGFIQVLSKRLDRIGWEHRVLASPVPTDAVVSMRLSALVVDLAVLGPRPGRGSSVSARRSPSSASWSARGPPRSPSVFAA